MRGKFLLTSVITIFTVFTVAGCGAKDAPKNSESANSEQEVTIEATVTESDSDLSSSLPEPEDNEYVDNFWESNEYTDKLPTPKSTRGEYITIRTDYMRTRVSQTTQEDFMEYVEACKQKGFDQIDTQSDHRYYATNSDGWLLKLRYDKDDYELKIELSKPDTESKTVKDQNVESEEETTESSDKLIDGMRSEFKQAMDDYSDYMNKYCDFMESYDASDVTMLAEYTKLLKEYSDFTSSFEKWNGNFVNETESNYYIKIQTDVNNRLLQIANQ